MRLLCQLTVSIQGQGGAVSLNSFPKGFIGKRLYKASLTSSRTSVYNAVKMTKKEEEEEESSLLGQIWSEQEPEMIQI